MKQMKQRKGKASASGVTATGGSKRKTVGPYPGGAQGMVAETHKAVGTVPGPERTFAPTVKTTK